MTSVILTDRKPLYERLVSDLDLRPDPTSDAVGIAYARNGGIFAAYAPDVSDPRAVLDSAEERTAAEVFVFATLGESLLSERTVGDVILPNVFLCDAADDTARPPLFLDLYEDMADFLYEDAFGLSVGGIALDARVPADADEDELARLRSGYESDAVTPGAYGLLGVHRLEKRASVFACVAGVEAIRGRSSPAGTDPVGNTAAIARTILDSFGG